MRQGFVTDTKPEAERRVLHISGYFSLQGVGGGEYQINFSCLSEHIQTKLVVSLIKHDSLLNQYSAADSRCFMNIIAFIYIPHKLRVTKLHDHPRWKVR